MRGFFGSFLAVWLFFRIVTSQPRGSLEELSVPSGYELKHVRMSSGLKLCLIAEGQVDWYPQLGETSIWDIAAPHAVLRSAGGEVRNLLTGQPLAYNPSSILNSPFLAARRGLFEVVTPLA